MVAFSDDARPQERGRSENVDVSQLSLGRFGADNDDGLAKRHFGALFVGFVFLIRHGLFWLFCGCLLFRFLSVSAWSVWLWLDLV